MRLAARLACLAFACCLLLACERDAALRPFSSDGCSLFPDRAPVGSADWCDCCLEHDIAYWRGGTRDERKAADERLRACVAEATGSEALASAMYNGVRAGGSPYFYTWYRWGYGWRFERKYQALSDSERDQAAALLEQYFASGEDATCDTSAR